MKQDQSLSYFEPVIYPDDQFLLPTKVKTGRSFEASPNLDLDSLMGKADLKAIVDLDKRVIVAITGSLEAAIGVKIGLRHAGVHHDEFGLYLR